MITLRGVGCVGMDLVVVGGAETLYKVHAEKLPFFQFQVHGKYFPKHPFFPRF